MGYFFVSFSGMDLRWHFLLFFMDFVPLLVALGSPNGPLGAPWGSILGEIRALLNFGFQGGSQAPQRTTLGCFGGGFWEYFEVC